MAKQSVKPGGILDFLSPEEFLSGMESQSNALLTALGKNAKYRRAIAEGVAANNGIALLNTVPDGFIWQILAYSVNAGVDRVLGAWTVYINNVSDMNNISASNSPFQAANGWFYVTNKAIVIRGGESLILSNLNGDGSQRAALTNGNPVTFQVAVLEVPFSHEAQLLL